MHVPLFLAQLSEAIHEAAPHVDGYAYPNERHVLWSVLIVIYPYITGLVAGAFIMASLVRVFNVRALTPVYRLALLTALAFLICAPLPLLLHLGHPERCLQVMLTPHLSSPMAMFGFVYAWYMMAVLLLELWLDYRHDFVRWGQSEPGLKGLFFRVLTLGVKDISPKALALDDRLSVAVTIMGIPSAFLLHGYVGFIFGSIKANPWWGNVLMPVIFIFSAIVSGIALCVFIYHELSWMRRKETCPICLDEMGKFLFYALLIDFSVEALDWLHRLYSADESVAVLKQLAAGRLFYTMLIGQLFCGTLIPLMLLGSTQLFGRQIPDFVRSRIYYASALLILAGVLLMRWNVVIGGQLFSKSLRGFTSFKLELSGQEGWLVGLGLLILPFLILTLFVRIFLPPGQEVPAHANGHSDGDLGAELPATPRVAMPTR